ncbi:MAG: hypothetical protein M1480_13735 [Bacteroidetes bacterium]|nr:hypothetical protein [Bacteroidota bacterium]
MANTNNAIDMGIIRRKVSEKMIYNEHNDYIIDLTLATVVSVELDRPVWIMIVAPPSSGKTEILKLTSKVQGIHTLPSITSKFLFSGHQSAQGGYIRREVKEKGVLVFPDFTTVLQKKANDRDQIFNQLRIIYDGKAGLGTGMDIAGIQNWEGKVAVLGCVTQSIETYKEKSNDLGERFLFYNFIPPSFTSDDIKGIDLYKGFDQKIIDQVADFIEEKKQNIYKVELTQLHKDKLYAYAQLIAVGRAAVERDGYNRDIINIHHPEQPFRILMGLVSLYKSLLCINEGNESRAFKIILEVVISTIPVMRANILRLIYDSKRALSKADLYDTLRISPTAIRRHIEEMIAQQMLEYSNSGDLIFTKSFKEIWSQIAA